MKDELNGNVQSLERALILLEKLAENPDGCSIKFLSEQTSLHKSTVHRLLHTLVNYGYVYQAETSERYHLGLKILSLSNGLLESLDVRSIARPFLEQLCQATGEAVHLSIQNDAFAVFIDKVENPNRTIRMYSQIGKTIPLYCSSSGKAILAWMPESKIRKLVGNGPFKRYTKNTITDLETLLTQLNNVRNQGYATDWFEHEDSIFCVASPVFDSTNQVVAAVSIAGTILQLNPERFLEYCAQVNKTTKLISARLGCSTYPAMFNPRQMEWDDQPTL